jgi:hypothetical protein
MGSHGKRFDVSEIKNDEHMIIESQMIYHSLAAVLNPPGHTEILNPAGSAGADKQVQNEIMSVTI